MVVLGVVLSLRYISTDVVIWYHVLFCRYRVGSDPAEWVSVDGETGLVKVRSPMDRESLFVKDGTYKALILAMDDGNPFSSCCIRRKCLVEKQG